MAASMRGLFATAKQRFKVPERLKRGFPKKVGEYFVNMYRDYRGATVDLLNDMKDRPVKAGIYITLLGLFGYGWSQNPDEISFEKELVDASNDLLLLSNLTRNPDSDKHIQRLLTLHNNGVLRRMNLGVCSIIWQDNFDRRVSMYDAKCDYLKVTWREFPDRILDVGFLGRWYYITKAMEDYDVNYLEFESKPGTNIS